MINSRAQHFVTFYSPGTFVSETNRVEVESWNVDHAVELARQTIQRHGARPYGFAFTSETRKVVHRDGIPDIKTDVTRSPMYYIGGKVETLQEIVDRNLKSEEILRSNMICNGYDRVIVNTNSYKSTWPLHAEDVVLDVEL